MIKEGGDEFIEGTKESDGAVRGEKSGVPRAFINADDFTTEEGLGYRRRFQDCVDEAEDELEEKMTALRCLTNEARVFDRGGGVFGCTRRGLRGRPEEGLKDIILDAVSAACGGGKGADEDVKGVHVNGLAEGRVGTEAPDSGGQRAVDGVGEPGLSKVLKRGGGAGATHTRIVCEVYAGKAVRGEVNDGLGRITEGGRAL